MFRKLAKSVKGYWKETLLAPTTVAIEVVMEVLIPYLMATLIDKGIEVGNMSVIVRMGLIMLLCCAISMAGGAFAGIFAAKASAGFAKNMRRRLFHAVQGFSFTNIDKFSTSSLVTRLTTDVSFVQNSFQMLIRIAVRSPLMMIFSLIMASRVSPKLSLIFLSVVPVLGLGLFIIAKNAMPTFSKVFKTYVPQAPRCLCERSTNGTKNERSACRPRAFGRSPSHHAHPLGGRAPDDRDRQGRFLQRQGHRVG